MNRHSNNRSSSFNPYQNPRGNPHRQSHHHANNSPYQDEPHSNINNMYNDPFGGIDSMLEGFDNMFNHFNRFSQFENNFFGNDMMNFGMDFPRLGMGNMNMDGMGGGQMQSSVVQMHSGFGGNPGTVITKSYMTKVDYNDGNPHRECYQSQSINQYNNGHKIQEKQEAYKNSRTGVEKAAFQRMLDEKGAKNIRQRNRRTGEQEEHNIYKGMNEEELGNFNQRFNDYKNQIGFQKNYEYLNKMNRKPMMIGDGRRVTGNLRGSNNMNNMNNQYRGAGGIGGRRGNPGQPLALPMAENDKYEYGNRGNNEINVNKHKKKHQ